VTFALIPASLFAVVLLPFAAVGALGVGYALLEHLKAGDPFWVVDLKQIGAFAGSAAGGVSGVIALWVAVFFDSDQLEDRRLSWATVLGLAAGATTAGCWLASGYWPWRSLMLTYPLVAASIVASYRLPPLIVAMARRAWDHTR
jgi:hypothetical protein